MVLLTGTPHRSIECTQTKQTHSLRTAHTLFQQYYASFCYVATCIPSLFPLTVYQRIPVWLLLHTATSAIQ